MEAIPGRYSLASALAHGPFTSYIIMLLCWEATTSGSETPGLPGTDTAASRSTRRETRVWGLFNPARPGPPPASKCSTGFSVLRPHLHKFLDPPHRQSTLETAHHAAALHLKTGSSSASPPRGLRPPGGPATPGAAPAPHLAPLLQRQGQGGALLQRQGQGGASLTTSPSYHPHFIWLFNFSRIPC